MKKKMSFIVSLSLAMVIPASFFAITSVSLAQQPALQKPAPIPSQQLSPPPIPSQQLPPPPTSSQKSKQSQTQPKTIPGITPPQIPSRQLPPPPTSSQEKKRPFDKRWKSISDVEQDIGSLNAEKVRVFALPPKTTKPFSTDDFIDPSTGKPVDPGKMIPVKSGDSYTGQQTKLIPASQLISELNKYEPEFNRYGYSLRSRGEVKFQEMVIDRTKLLRQEMSARSTRFAINTMVQPYNKTTLDRIYNDWESQAAYRREMYNRMIQYIQARQTSGTSVHPVQTPPVSPVSPPGIIKPPTIQQKSLATGTPPVGSSQPPAVSVKPPIVQKKFGISQQPILQQKLGGTQPPAGTSQQPVLQQKLGGSQPSGGTGQLPAGGSQQIEKNISTLSPERLLAGKQFLVNRDFKNFPFNEAYDKTWGDEDTIAASLHAKLEVKGEQDKVVINAEGGGSGTLFNQSKEIIGIKGNVSCPGQTSNQDTTTTLKISVLGRDISLIDDARRTRKQWDGYYNAYVDKSIKFTYSIGPIPVNVKLGFSGNASLSYGLLVEAALPHAVVQVIPEVYVDAYARCGVSALIVEAGAGANLLLLGDRLDITADIGMKVESDYEPYFEYNFLGQNTIDVLNGKVYAYVTLDLWLWSNTWKWDIFSWTGYSDTQELFNEGKRWYPFGAEVTLTFRSFTDKTVVPRESAGFQEVYPGAQYLYVGLVRTLNPATGELSIGDEKEFTIAQANTPQTLNPYTSKIQSVKSTETKVYFVIHAIRFGTYIDENGKIGFGTKYLKFTQSPSDWGMLLIEYDRQTQKVTALVPERPEIPQQNGMWYASGSDADCTFTITEK